MAKYNASIHKPKPVDMKIFREIQNFFQDSKIFHEVRGIVRKFKKGDKRCS